MYGSFRDTWQNGLFYRQQIAYTCEQGLQLPTVHPRVNGSCTCKKDLQLLTFIPQHQYYAIPLTISEHMAYHIIYHAML